LGEEKLRGASIQVGGSGKNSGIGKLYEGTKPWLRRLDLESGGEGGKKYDRVPDFTGRSSCT